MLVEVIVAELPYVGRRGAQRNLDDAQARALILLNKVRAVGGDDAPRGRRIYQRRDMVAEPDAATEAPPPTVTQPPSPSKKKRKPKVHAEAPSERR